MAADFLATASPLLRLRRRRPTGAGLFCDCVARVRLAPGSLATSSRASRWRRGRGVRHRNMGATRPHDPAPKGPRGEERSNGRFDSRGSVAARRSRDARSDGASRAVRTLGSFPGGPLWNPRLPILGAQTSVDVFERRSLSLVRVANLPSSASSIEVTSARTVGAGPERLDGCNALRRAWREVRAPKSAAGSGLGGTRLRRSTIGGGHD